MLQFNCRTPNTVVLGLISTSPACSVLEQGALNQILLVRLQLRPDRHDSKLVERDGNDQISQMKDASFLHSLV